MRRLPNWQYWHSQQSNCKRLLLSLAISRRWFHWKGKGFRPYTQKMVEFRTSGLKNWILERPHTETKSGRSSVPQFFMAITCRNSLPIYYLVARQFVVDVAVQAVDLIHPHHTTLRRTKQGLPAGSATRARWIGLAKTGKGRDGDNELR